MEKKFYRETVEAIFADEDSKDKMWNVDQI